MDSNIIISIIIPVYNVEKYLCECLDSIFAQTFQAFEIICVDDGSNDKSLEILKQYKLKDNRLTILQQNHKGAGAARNLGLKYAKGKYVQFLDSDDYFEPTLLDEMYEKAQKYNTDITICSSKKVNDNGEIIEKANPNSPINLAIAPLDVVFSPSEHKENIFSMFSPILWNKLYLKKIIIENNIQFPILDTCEDVGFVHSCFVCAKRILAFNKELINYRFNRKGSMASYRSKYTIDVVKSCLYLKDFLKSKGLFFEYENAYKMALLNHIKNEISYCNNEEYEIFLNEFKKTLPNEWQNYQSVFKKDYITCEYLKEIIADKKVFLWGASIFLQKLLEKEPQKNPNILGIIDKNVALWGKKCGNYEIFSPEILNKIKSDGIIVTVFANFEIIYQNIKEEVSKNYPNTKVLPSIFK